MRENLSMGHPVLPEFRLADVLFSAAAQGYACASSCEADKLAPMIRPLLTSAAALALLLSAASGHAFAQDSKKQQDQKAKSAQKTAQPDNKSKANAAGKADAKASAAKPAAAASAAAAGGAAKPNLIATNGDWETYQAQGAKGKICYALSRPKDRQPGNLTRDPGYIFISTRPGEGVRGEISIIMGFPLKENATNASAAIGSTTFGLVAKGTNAWVKNAAEESQLIDAMRKGARSKLIVKAPSVKGNVTTDTYSLAGLAQALDRVNKECP